MTTASTMIPISIRLTKRAYNCVKPENQPRGGALNNARHAYGAKYVTKLTEKMGVADFPILSIKFANFGTANFIGFADFLKYYCNMQF